MVPRGLPRTGRLHHRKQQRAGRSEAHGQTSAAWLCRPAAGLWRSASGIQWAAARLLLPACALRLLLWTVWGLARSLLAAVVTIPASRRAIACEVSTVSGLLLPL